LCDFKRKAVGKVRDSMWKALPFIKNWQRNDIKDKGSKELSLLPLSYLLSGANGEWVKLTIPAGENRPFTDLTLLASFYFLPL
jgi:hypothetical protein